MTTDPTELGKDFEAEQWNADAYRKAAKEYRFQVARAFAASMNNQRIDGGERRHWSSVIFLRVVLVSGSIGKLLPDIDDKVPLPWWDFSSFGALVRSLFELLLFFRYFTEPSSEVEWLAKLNLMQLNDCSERIRFFTTTRDDKQVKDFQVQQEALVRKLEANPVIQAIEGKQRKQLLYGFRPSILTQREIATKLKIHEDIWSQYQFLSSYTHSLPMSFYRTYEQERFGHENDVDRGYFIMTLAWITDILKASTTFYEQDMQSSEVSKNR